MNDTKRSSANSRLIIQLGVPFVAFFLFVLVALLFSAYVAFERNKLSASIIPQQEAQKLQGHLQQLIKSVEDFSALAATNIDPNSRSNELPVSDAASTPTASSFLSGIVVTNPSILELVFFNPNGQEILRVTKPSVGSVTEPSSDVRGENFFVHAMEGQEYFDTPFFSDQNIPFVYWSFPMKNGRGEIVGVMRTTVDVSTMWNVITQNTTGEAFIVDQNGVVLVSRDLRASSPTQSLSGFRDLSQSARTSSGVAEYLNHEGKDVLASWYMISPTPWMVVVEIPVLELYQDFYRLLTLLVVLIVMAILMMTYEWIILNRRVFKPLAAMRTGAARLTQGDFNFTIVTDAHNEFDTLSESFNDMSVQLRGTYQNLERRVSERTLELNEQVAQTEELNKFMVGRELQMIKLKKEITELKEKLAEHDDVSRSSGLDEQS